MFESSSTFVRTYSGDDRVHWYTFDAVDDHRYLVTVQSTSLAWSSGWLLVDGQFSGNTVQAGPGTIAELVVEPWMTGPYPLRIQGLALDAAEYSYRILVSELPAAGASESESESASLFTLLEIGAPHAATIDYASDLDDYILSEPPGGRYVVTLRGTGDHPLTTGVLGRPYNSYLGSSTGQLALPYNGWTGFQVRSAGGTGDYEVVVTLKPPDDHPDDRVDATSLDQVRVQQGVIEIPGDFDTFQINDLPGQRIQISLVPTGLEDRSALSLVAWAPQATFRASINGSVGSNIFVLPGTGLGPIFLSVTGLVSDASYTVQARLLPPDDHSDMAAGATPLPLTQAVVGRLDGRPDVDTFALELDAGRRYRIEVDTDSSDTSQISAMLQGHQDRSPSDLPKQNAWSMGNGDIVVQAVVPDSGLYTFRLAGAPAAYTVRLSVLEPDDHADSALGATAAGVGRTTSGQLSGGFDVDSFVFDAAAGQKYRVTLTTSDPEGSSQHSLNWSGPGGAGGYAQGGYGGLPKTMELSLVQSGPVVVQINGREPDSWLYWLRVDPIAAVATNDDSTSKPDDRPPSSHLNATHLTVGGVYTPNFIDGGAGDDRLTGTDGDDVIRGAGGHDRFVFGPGYDKVDGGAGLDVLQVPGARQDYEWQWDRSAGSWWLAERADLDTTRLEGVERIEFSDQGLLLEAGGGASGDVLRLLQALFGDRSLYSYIGQALSLHDEGHDLAALAAWALARPELSQTSGGGSNDGLVRWVSNNVPGLLGSEAEILYWADKLDRGDVTPAQALIAAVTQAPPEIYLVGLQFPIGYSVGEGE